MSTTSMRTHQPVESEKLGCVGEASSCTPGRSHPLSHPENQETQQEVRLLWMDASEVKGNKMARRGRLLHDENILKR